MQASALPPQTHIHAQTPRRRTHSCSEIRFLFLQNSPRGSGGACSANSPQGMHPAPYADKLAEAWPDTRPPIWCDFGLSIMAGSSLHGAQSKCSETFVLMCRRIPIFRHLRQMRRRLPEDSQLSPRHAENYCVVGRLLKSRRSWMLVT